MSNATQISLLTIYVSVMPLLEGPKAERQANRLAHLKTAIFLWHSCWIFPLFSQWTRPQRTIFILTKFLPQLRIHGQIYIPWGNVFSSFCFFFSAGPKFGDAPFFVLKTTGYFVQNVGQSNLWDIFLKFETNIVQVGLRMMQSNFYLRQYFSSSNIHPLGECFLFPLFFNGNKIWRCFFLSFGNYRWYGTI